MVLLKMNVIGINESMSVIAIGTLLLWFIFFIIKSIAGYVLWSRPYTSRIKGSILSIIAIFLVYVGLYSANNIYLLFSGIMRAQGNLKWVYQAFFEFHKTTLGIPYIAAAIVGWFFARPAPDVSEHF